MPIKSKGDGGGGTVDLSAIQQQIDSLDPSRPLGSFDPATFSDGPLPAADRNDYLWASAAGTITLNGTDHEVTKGDWVRCDVDGTAANTPANWSFVDRIGTNGNAVQSVAGSAVDNSDPTNPVVDACAINEFIHSGMPAFHLVFAHEGDGGTTMVVRKNGDPVTYQNLVNATDVGNGQANFSSGANSNYNRRASTVETIQYPGDYFEIIKPATPPFDSEYGTLSTDPAALANTAQNWRWVWTETNWFLRSPENINGTDNFATGGPENATYRIERTLAGFEFRRNGELVHKSECEWADYTDQQTTTHVFDGATIDAAPPWEGLVSIGDQATKVIPTGVDLSQVDEVRVTFGRTNQTWGKITVPFDPSEIDFGKLQGTLLPHFGDTYLSIANMTAAQFEAGNIPFRTVTGQATFGFEISRIQFKKRVSVQSPIIEVQNTGTIITTGTFQNLGDPNPLFTGEDFARLHIEYGDGTRDQFTFLDGLVKEERKGFENYEIEARVVNGQIQIRDLGTQSGISKAWYAHPAGATRIPAATGEVFIEVASQFVTVEEDFAFSGTDYLPVPLTSAVDSPILGFDVQAGKRYKFKFGLRMLRANATADLRLQVTGPAGSTGMTAYQSIENAISQAVTFGDPSIAIAVAAVTVDAHADLHYAEGWLVAGADGRVELSIRNNAGTSQQTLGALSFVESKEV